MNQLYTYSIFYHQEGYYQVLKLIENWVGLNPSVARHLIKISDFRGWHLELTIVLKKHSPVSLLDVLASELKGFLSHEPSNNDSMEITSHALFTK